jgi:hypothetical protein
MGGGREETATWQGNDTCNKTQGVCGVKLSKRRSVWSKAVTEKECVGAKLSQRRSLCGAKLSQRRSVWG